MNFGMITLNQNMEIKQDYATQILIALLLILNLKIFTENVFATDTEKWFDTSIYDENDKRPLPIGKNKKVIGLFKDELGGKIMKEFVSLRAKIYASLMDDDSEHKRAKGTKSVE